MTVGRAGLLALAVAAGSAAAPAVAEAPVVRDTTAWTATQDEAMCGGQVVPVTYEGTLTVREVRGGSWLRVRTDLRWEQGGVRYAGHASGGFSAPPSGRVTTYRIHGSAVGTNGVRVHLAEVVHAVWSDGEPTVRVEFDRVVCR